MGRRGPRKEEIHATVNLNPKLWEQLKMLSASSGIAIKDLIAAAIGAHMDAGIQTAIAKLEALQKERE